MSYSQSTPFGCPNCAAKYEVRVQAPQGPTTDREITCLSCGAPRPGREGPFILKYFLVERPKRRAGRCRISCARRNQRKESKHCTKPCCPSARESWHPRCWHGKIS